MNTLIVLLSHVLIRRIPLEILLISTIHLCLSYFYSFIFSISSPSKLQFGITLCVCVCLLSDYVKVDTAVRPGMIVLCVLIPVVVLLLVLFARVWFSRRSKKLRRDAAGNVQVLFSVYLNIMSTRGQ